MKVLAQLIFITVVLAFLVDNLNTVWAGVIAKPATKGTKLWTRSGKFEGDIVMTDYLKVALLEKNGILLNNTKLMWPNTELVYNFSKELTQSQKDGFEACLKKELADSCVTTRRADENDVDYVLVTTWDEGCYSNIGRQGGEQQLNLEDPGCYTCDTIVHEVLHAFGFAHMQSDPLRDDYIYVNWTNVQKNQTYNFEKYNWVSSYDVPYDFLSVMHYEWNAFAIDDNSPTMFRHSDEDKYVLGNNIGMTDSDMVKLNYIYCEPPLLKP